MSTTLADISIVIDPKTAESEKAGARRRLAEISPDLAPLAEKTSELLNKLSIQPQESKATLHRLAAGSMRELSNSNGSLNNAEMLQAVKRALTSTLASEAAGELHTQRVGVDLVRQSLSDRHGGFGKSALDAMQRVTGNDLMLERLDNIDLKMVAHGSYDRVSAGNKQALAQLLKTDGERLHDPVAVSISRSVIPAPENDRQPAVSAFAATRFGPRREARTAPVPSGSAIRRQQTFGKKMAAAQAFAAQRSNSF